MQPPKSMEIYQACWNREIGASEGGEKAGKPEAHFPDMVLSFGYVTNKELTSG